MKPAHFNFANLEPAQHVLAEQVLAWLGTVNPQKIYAMGQHFRVSTTYMRAVVEHLEAAGKIRHHINQRARHYSVFRERPRVEATVSTFKPLKPNKQLSERYAEIQAQRAAFPSKHI